eukprot:5234085-Pyramimonas_sp.AAC.2
MECGIARLMRKSTVALPSTSSRQGNRLARASRFRAPSRHVLRVCAALRDMEGQTVVVMGLGASGRAAARLAVARGAMVIGVDSNEKATPLELSKYYVVSVEVSRLSGSITT